MKHSAMKTPDNKTVSSPDAEKVSTAQENLIHRIIQETTQKFETQFDMQQDLHEREIKALQQKIQEMELKQNPGTHLEPLETPKRQRPQE